MTPKEAIKIVKDNWSNCHVQLQDALKTLIPECCESDDEKIRKEIARYFKNYSGGDGISVEFPKWIAWLERLGEQNIKLIQWKGDNLREVIEFTGKSPKFNEWFKTWDDFEKYVHSHGNIFKLFCEDGNHYEVPVGAWIVKTPDGYNVASKATFVKKLSNNQSSLVIDKKLLNEVIECLKYLNYWVCGGNDTLIGKLKRLKPQSCCKSSDEQKLTGKPKVYSSMDDLIADALIEEIKGSDLPASSKHNRIFWIKSHRQRFVWSEEDTKLLNLSLENLTELKNRFGEKYGKVGDCINWLKSLKERVQPKVEQTQLDQNILSAAIAFVEQNDHFNCWGGVDKHTVLSALHSLKSQKIWKPSNAQMQALEKVRVILHNPNIWDESNPILYQYEELMRDLMKLREE